MRLAALVLCFCAAPSSGAPVPKDAVKAQPQAGLEDTWKVVSMRRGANAFQLPPGGQMMSFAPGALTVTSNPRTADEVVTTATAGYDHNQKHIYTTHHIDARGQIVNPNVAYGYTIDGDKLTLATQQAPNLAFNAISPADAGDNAIVYVLTRVKK